MYHKFKGTVTVIKEQNRREAELCLLFLTQGLQFLNVFVILENRVLTGWFVSVWWKLPDIIFQEVFLLIVIMFPPVCWRDGLCCCSIACDGLCGEPALLTIDLSQTKHLQRQWDWIPCLEKWKKEKEKKQNKQTNRKKNPTLFSKHKTFHSNKLLFIGDNFLVISLV